MSAWERLDAELDAWRAGGRCATLWCRDDDACRDSPALQRLLGVARDAGVPVALAAIPAALEASLVAAVAGAAIATVVQHGYAHRNHAPPGARNWELGAERPVAVVRAELEAGRAALERAFGGRFAAVLVPPWNRVSPEVVAELPGAGIRALSTFGPRVAACPVSGLLQVNTHVDLISWRRDRAFIGADSAIERVLEHLRARREGAADAAEPTGILTHHLDLDDAAWAFLAEFMARTRAHAAVAWLDACAVFGAGAVRSPATSGR